MLRLIQFLKSFKTDYLFYLRFLISFFPAIYYPLYARKEPFKHMAVNKNTNLCVEGFPRSANSFFVAALHISNKNLSIAHHHHTISQLIQAANHQIPAIVLIREPRKTMTSWLLFQRSKRIKLYLKIYKKFYSYADSQTDKILFVRFDTIISDFNVVIEKINHHFSMNLNTINDMDYKRKEIMKQLDDVNNKYFAGNTNQSLVPNEDHNQAKARLLKLVADDKYLTIAENLYKKIEKKAI